MSQEEQDKRWHEISDKLTGYFGICGCQRKIKSIIDNLYSIYVKCDYENPDRNFTGAEWLIIAILDAGSDLVTHGVNCEYPIIIKDHPFWLWVLEVKDDPCLVDN